MATYELPDGRSLEVERMPDHVHWHLHIHGPPDTEIVGTPLGSTLAELFGYKVAHEEWPAWIDDLASEVEEALGGH